MHFFKQVIILLAASVAVIATAQESKEIPKAAQEVLAVSAKADAQAEADLKAAQLKALAKKIEGRKAAIKAAESAIRTAAIKGDASLEALVATKAELQTQIKELEEAGKDAQATPEKQPRVALSALAGKWRYKCSVNGRELDMSFDAKGRMTFPDWSNPVVTRVDGNRFSIAFENRVLVLRNQDLLVSENGNKTPVEVFHRVK